MKSRIILDSNIFLSYLIKDDLFTQAETILTKAIKEDYLIYSNFFCVRRGFYFNNL